MRNFGFHTYCLLIGLAGSSVAACASVSASAGLEGAWEGFFAKSMPTLLNFMVTPPFRLLVVSLTSLALRCRLGEEESIYDVQLSQFPMI